MKPINKKVAAGLLALPLMTVAGAAYANTDATSAPHAEDIECGIELTAEEQAYFAKFDKVISDNDWDTLSMKQIDAKLVAAGLEAVGDEADPLYNMTGAEIEKLTEADWAKIEAQYPLYNDDDYEESEDDVDVTDEEWDKIEALFTDAEWDTLSDEEFERRVNEAGLGGSFELDAE